MKNVFRLTVLYLAYLLIAGLGGAARAHFVDSLQRTYSGAEWIAVISAMTTVFLILIIIIRTSQNMKLKCRSLLILNLLFVVISLILTIYSYTDAPFLYTKLSMSPDTFPLVMIALLTSDVYDAGLQFKA